MTVQYDPSEGSLQSAEAKTEGAMPADELAGAPAREERSAEEPKLPHGEQAAVHPPSAALKGAIQSNGEDASARSIEEARERLMP